jgi:hypothetical protein
MISFRFYCPHLIFLSYLAPSFHQDEDTRISHFFPLSFLFFLMHFHFLKRCLLKMNSHLLRRCMILQLRKQHPCGRQRLVLLFRSLGFDTTCERSVEEVSDRSLAAICMGGTRWSRAIALAAALLPRMQAGRALPHFRALATQFAGALVLTCSWQRSLLPRWCSRWHPAWVEPRLPREVH